MNDFFELEKKCKKLKLKKVLKLSLIIFILFLVIVGISIYVFKNNKVKEKKETKIIHKQHQLKPKIIIKEKNITKIVVKKIYIEKNITKPEVVPPKLNLDINFSNVTEIENNKKEIKNKEYKISEVKSNKIIENETITFQKALTLAKKYYENGDYQNSIKWCKIASKIDNNDARIWKLYALNLEKTNQKQKAIKVLQTYLKYKNSLELRYLLQRLEE